MSGYPTNGYVPQTVRYNVDTMVGDSYSITVDTNNGPAADNWEAAVEAGMATIYEHLRAIYPSMTIYRSLSGVTESASWLPPAAP